ncbi:P-loop containing nucleoside triphosphate hydrolase protein [Trichodelitschia bisporula]|uniref:P-loop containing nucleoside triphosphate hydrolase protein n=1 Tax=Trichodelitschia bisporula TaxID=703511 RepID=A0A6G1HMH6_9PEZI|nr:P-loop containing nucleoside triphosphate hydrolase protein [Trichodelitschia bisporula]
MTDLLRTLPDFSTAPFSHLLPSLDRTHITTADLLTLDAGDVAKRAQLPPAEVAKLTRAVVDALHTDLGVGDGVGDKENGDAGRKGDLSKDDGFRAISTLDPVLDDALGGGIPRGFVTEITGASIYISTEAPLSTPRLAQILTHNTALRTLPSAHCPSLTNILAIQTPDLESQDHILYYQLPVAIERHSARLVVIDSIAANYRAEIGTRVAGGPHPLALRRAHLQRTGAHLRSLALKYNIAIVVANQVADRFEAELSPRSGGDGITPDPLALDHQQRWFTGWGDGPTRGQPKTPSLGLVWANQIAARIALVREEEGEGERRRWMKVVWAACDIKLRDGRA